MTPEDNLEKYFKNVLKEDSLQPEEEWSIPSDDLWEAAKVHFPKKKKKDRAIFFWLGIGVSCLLMGIGVPAFLNQKTKIETPSITNEHSIKDTKQQINNKINQTITTKYSEKINTLIKKENNTKKIQEQPNNNQVANQKGSIIKAKKESDKSRLIATSLSKTTEEIKVKKSVENFQNEIKQEQRVNSNHENKPISITKIAELNELKQPIPFLVIPERPLILKENRRNITIPVKSKFKQWEIGLSYAPFILFQESIINEGSTSNFASQAVKIKHQNINLNLRRYLSPRISVSSGLYLSKGAIDLTLCDKGVYENNNNIATLRYFIKESDNVNQINLSDLGVNLDASFEFVEEANLRSGDSLTLKGNLPFKVKLIQMPILFNLHFGKGKFKGLVHTGISLDYLSAKVNEPQWGLFKETELISKPVAFDPLNEQLLKIRLQAGLGIRYAIKDFLQIGTGININISEPILSRFDLGVYYGF